MTTATELVDKMAEKLHCTRAKLSTVPTQVLIRMMTDDDLTAAQQAGMFLLLGTTDPLREHFSEQEKRQREQWRVVEQKHAADRVGMKKVSLGALQKDFIDMSKHQLLTEEEAMIGTYVLFGDDDARKFFSCTLMRKRNFERVQAHNFFVASSMSDPEYFLTTHGVKLLTMPYPLFPPTEEFTSINTKLLFDVVEGGAAATTLPRIYRYGPGVTGGGYAPIGQLHDGSWHADTTALEQQNQQEVQRQQQINAELRKQIAGMERKLSLLGAPPRVNRQQQQPQQQRGGYRGRGGGRALHGGEAVTEVSECPTSTPPKQGF